MTSSRILSRATPWLRRQCHRPIYFTATILPPFQQHRHFTSPPTTTTNTTNITLFQYDVCPFCNKVKAVLNAIGREYDTVEVNPMGKPELKFSTQYRKVPLALFHQHDLDRVVQVNGSSDIVEAALDLVVKEKRMTPAQLAELRGKDTDRWVEYSTKELAVLMYPNMTNSLVHAAESLRYISDVPNFTLMTKITLRILGPLAMAFGNRRLKAKYNIIDERKALFFTVNKWTTALSLSGRRFHGGDERPDIADLSVFGVIRGVQETRVFRDMIRYTDIEPWYRAMEAYCGDRHKMRQRRKSLADVPIDKIILTPPPPPPSSSSSS